MKILAIDSSGLVASVAVVTDEDVIAEYTFNYKKTHSITLMPMVEEIIKKLELDLNVIDGIAVSAGPGSFTGLRIGASTGKGLGLALNKPMICIPSLDALAFNLFKTDSLICPIMDARRNQVYTGIYEFIGDEFITIKSQIAVEINEIADEINQLNKSVIFLGDGVPVYKDILRELLKVPFYFAPVHVSKQRAGAVGALGIEYMKKGIVVSADEFEPIYLRASQAERELEEKKNVK